MYKPSNKYRSDNKKANKAVCNALTMAIESIEENKKAFTAKQFARAKQACDFYHSVGAPTTANLKKLIQMNYVHDCPVN